LRNRYTVPTQNEFSLRSQGPHYPNVTLSSLRAVDLDTGNAGLKIRSTRIWPTLTPV